MAESAALELQRALYEALTGDAALMAAIAGVWDHVPETAQRPYVVIGESFLRDWSMKGLAGHEHRLTLHAYSQAAGQSQTHVLLAHIGRILAAASLHMPTHHLVGLWPLSSRVLKPGDGLSHHGIAEFRALTHHLEALPS